MSAALMQPFAHTTICTAQTKTCWILSLLFPTFPDLDTTLLFNSDRNFLRFGAIFTQPTQQGQPDCKISREMLSLPLNDIIKNQNLIFLSWTKLILLSFSSSPFNFVIMIYLQFKARLTRQGHVLRSIAIR